MQYIQNIIEDIGESAAEDIALETCNMLAKSCGFPITVIGSAVKVLFKSGVKTIIQDCYSDIKGRNISRKETYKHELLVDTAYKTFFNLIGKNQYICNFSVNDDHFEYAYQVAEHISIEAMRQYENEKIKILGRFYGRQFFYGNRNWDDIHYIVSLISALSLRQLILIQLISKGFENNDMFITNKFANVEINMLLGYGIWYRDKLPMDINNSLDIRIADLISTEQAHYLRRELLLDEIDKEVVNNVIESLDLKTVGNNPTHFLYID